VHQYSAESLLCIVCRRNYDTDSLALGFHDLATLHAVRNGGLVGVQLGTVNRGARFIGDGVWRVLFNDNNPLFIGREYFEVALKRNKLGNFRKCLGVFSQRLYIM
jgi:hypothetical protein